MEENKIPECAEACAKPELTETEKLQMDIGAIGAGLSEVASAVNFIFMALEVRGLIKGRQEDKKRVFDIIKPEIMAEKQEESKIIQSGIIPSA